MKIKNVLIITLLLSPFAFNSVAAKHNKKDTFAVCRTGQCYCAIKCGPREIKREQGDEPFVDAKSGIYFCHNRDQHAYYTKGCPNAKNFCTGPSGSKIKDRQGNVIGYKQ